MLKTNQTKFEVISVRRQKAGFLSPRSSKIIVTKEKERTKRKSEEKERRRRGQSNIMVALLVFIIEYFGDITFGDNVINNPARYI